MTLGAYSNETSIWVCVRGAETHTKKFSHKLVILRQSYLHHERSYFLFIIDRSVGPTPSYQPYAEAQRFHFSMFNKFRSNYSGIIEEKKTEAMV